MDSVTTAVDSDSLQERTERLRKLHLVSKHLDELVELQARTFRVKQLDEMTRGDVYSLKEFGLVKDSGSNWGRVVDWTLTDEAEAIVTALLVNDVDEQILDDYAIDVVERHPELLLELPDEGVEFQASDFDLNGSLLACLRRADLLNRKEQRTGSPDTWSVSARGRRVKSYLRVSTNDVEAWATGKPGLEDDE